MNDRIPIDPAKVQLVRQYLEKFLFSDVKQRSDEQMWTHFSFNERPKRSEIVFHRKFLDDCKSLNPGKSIVVGEMGGLSIEDRDRS